MHHFALGVADIQAPYKTATERGYEGGAAEDRTRRQVAAQSLRSEPYSRRDHGVQAGPEAVLLADESVKGEADDEEAYFTS